MVTVDAMVEEVPLEALELHPVLPSSHGAGLKLSTAHSSLPIVATACTTFLPLLDLGHLD